MPPVLLLSFVLFMGGASHIKTQHRGTIAIAQVSHTNQNIGCKPKQHGQRKAPTTVARHVSTNILEAWLILRFIAKCVPEASGSKNNYGIGVHLFVQRSQGGPTVNGACAPTQTAFGTAQRGLCAPPQRPNLTWQKPGPEHPHNKPTTITGHLQAQSFKVTTSTQHDAAIPPKKRGQR